MGRDSRIYLEDLEIMTVEEKNKVVLGVAFEAPIVVEKEEINPRTQEKEIVLDYKTEIITLRPVKIKHWAELDATSITNMPQKLIEFSSGKSAEWIENTLNSCAFVELYEKCKEINRGFFERMDLQKELLKKHKETLKELMPEVKTEDSSSVK